MTKPKITFGIIVLNGEPFIEYNLRSLYPFAHQIIVVEGASPAAKNISTPEGHSTDGTLEKLRQFKRTEDYENKIIIVTAEDEGHANGFWPGEKDEQSQAYAKRATGNYLWQVDIDEFYKTEDLVLIINMLENNPAIDAVSFNTITFWGGINYVVDGWYLRWGAKQYHRLFRWKNSYKYANHRPPTVIDNEGINLRNKTWISGNEMSKKGIHLFHYSLLFPKQVKDKTDYYAEVEWNNKSNRMDLWAEKNYFKLGNPFKVHNVYTHLSWLDNYLEDHPKVILEMMEKTKTEDKRRNSDIEKLLKNWLYKTIRMILICLEKPVYYLNQLLWTIRNLRKVLFNKNFRIRKF